MEVLPLHLLILWKLRLNQLRSNKTKVSITYQLSRVHLHLPSRAFPPFPSSWPKTRSGRRNHPLHDSKLGKPLCDPVFQGITSVRLFSYLYSVIFMQQRTLHAQELVTPLLSLVLSHCMSNHFNSLFSPCQNVTYLALPNRFIGNIWLWGRVLGHQDSVRVQVHFCSHFSDFEKHEAFVWMHIYKHSHKNIHGYTCVPPLGICREQCL